MGLEGGSARLDGVVACAIRGREDRVAPRGHEGCQEDVVTSHFPAAASDRRRLWFSATKAPVKWLRSVKVSPA
jgi:hypothetical protein